jgi:PAS domain S-box-containing protein
VDDSKGRNVRRYRLSAYLALATTLGVIAVFTHESAWSGFDEIHTLLEGSSAIVALIVSAMAFTRHYSQPEGKYLWLAVGFLGAGLLEAYHTALTTWLSAVYFPALLDKSAEWSEFTPQMFLAAVFCLSAWHPHGEAGGRKNVKESVVYVISALLLIACFAVLSIDDLPSVHAVGAVFVQPSQAMPAMLFGLAIVGYFRNGQWSLRDREFDHWVIFALILSIMGHAGFMGFSAHKLDAGFDIAHLVKFVSYLCVLVGLLISMRSAFRLAADSDRRFREAVQTLGEGFALYDDEDRLVVFNDAYLKLHPATRDIIKVGMKFEDFVKATVKSRTIESSSGNEEEYIRTRVAQHRNPTEPIVRELNDGTSYIINESRTAEGWIAVVETDITEIKKIEGELAEKSGFLEATFDAMDDGISVWSPDNRLLAFNEKFETLMGREDDRAVSGMHIRDLFIMNARAGLYGDGDPEKLGHERYEGAMRAAPDGRQYITFQNHGTYEVLRNLMPDGSRVTIHRNITDRIAAEQRLTGVVENLSEIFVLWDSQDRLVMHNKRFVEVNAAVADICKPGLSFEEFIRTGVERGMFPEAGPDPEEWVQRRFREHRQPMGIHEIERENGHWMLMHQQRLPDGGTVSISSDISDIKRAEAKVLEREQRLTAIVENVVDGIITFDRRGVILSANTSAAAIFGVVGREILGHRMEEYLSDSELDGSAEEQVAKLLTGEFVGIQELHGRRWGGEEFPMELAATRVETEDEWFYVCIVRDISSRREMERMKNEFVSTVSHELRTPLTSIRASLGLIVAGAVGEVPDQASELVAIAERNARRLIGLVNDILDMEKFENGRMDFHFAEHSVTDLVRQALVDNQGYADEHDIEFEFVDETEGVKAILDSQRINQVMANLLSNAAKFSPSGSIVRIRTSVMDKNIRIAVIDSGSGIPDAFRAEVFEKFTQADSTDTRKVGGTGLGLSISRAIVERHGGIIDFINEPDGGANFYFDLPLRASVESKAGETKDTPSKADERPLILICEDDVDVADLISMMVKNKGYNSEIAYTAEEAERLALTGRFAAVTVDLMLPDVDGLTLMRNIRAHKETKYLPIVVVSAAVDQTPESVKTSCVEIVDWMSKPIDEDQLITAIATAVGHSTDRAIRILHVEDDIDLRQILRRMLPSNIELISAVNLSEAEAKLKREKFDLVILDVFLPDGSGLDLLQLLRSNGHVNTPTLLFSAEEVEQTISEQVAGALVKSRTSNGELLDTISSLIERETTFHEMRREPQV